jgi:hypothetical protein
MPGAPLLASGAERAPSLARSPGREHLREEGVDRPADLWPVLASQERHSVLVAVEDEHRLLPRVRSRDPLLGVGGDTESSRARTRRSGPGNPLTDSIEG